MKKTIILVSILGILLAANLVMAKNSDEKNPFELIWEAIANLQEQIDNIVLQPGPEGPPGLPGPNIFPPPAFDSGWIIVPPYMAVIDINHSVGGDINDYFIYATYRRHNGSFTSHQTAADRIWWEDVEPNNIQLITNGNVTNEFEAARIQIWVVGQ